MSIYKRQKTKDGQRTVKIDTSRTKMKGKVMKNLGESMKEKNIYQKEQEEKKLWKLVCSKQHKVMLPVHKCKFKKKFMFNNQPYQKAR